MNWLVESLLLIVVWLPVRGHAAVHMRLPSNSGTKIYGTAGISLQACTDVMAALVLFCADDPTVTCGCINPAYLATLSGCLQYLNQYNADTKSRFLTNCALLDIQIFDETLEIYSVLAVSIDELANFNVSIPVEVPIKLNSTLVNIYQRSYHAYYGNFDRSIIWGSGLLGYWLCILFVASICHWAQRLNHTMVKTLPSSLTNFWRHHVSLPATFEPKHNVPAVVLEVFEFLIPNRLELLILTGFLILVGVSSGVGYQFAQPDPKFPLRVLAVCRLVGDRTGILATAMMPLVILFAGRNNFLQWLTGWNFARFICFHRWTARILFILVFIHAFAFTVRLGIRKIYGQEAAHAYFIWGLVATVAMGIIVVQSLLRLRRSWYEMFLAVHIAMAAIFIAGSWIHVTTLGYVWYFYAATAVWVFDRAVRLVRLFMFGLVVARVQLVTDSTLKVTIPCPSWWNNSAGGHAFIHFIRPSCFWQSHPFTFVVNPKDRSRLIMYIKVKAGTTHGLVQYLMATPGRCVDIKVIVEGPYGGPSGASRYDHCVFIAGGHGIPGIYSEALDCATKLHENSSKRVRLYWIVRGYDEISWFSQELIALKGTAVEPIVIVTKPDHQLCLDGSHMLHRLHSKGDVLNMNNSESYHSKTKTTEFANRIVSISSAFDHVKFLHGRYTMDSLFHHEIEISSGLTAFVTCGHPGMVDDLRHIIFQNLDHSAHRIDFFQQLQVWS